MNAMEFSDHSIKKQHMDYFIHLVRVAKADDVITAEETALLHMFGKKMGYSEAEVENLILTTSKSDYIPPYKLAERFEQVYGIVKMSLADGAIDKNEMRIAGSFAAKSGFTDQEIPKLLVLIISGIRKGIDEEELFEMYRKNQKISTMV